MMALLINFYSICKQQLTVAQLCLKFNDVKAGMLALALVIMLFLAKGYRLAFQRLWFSSNSN